MAVISISEFSSLNFRNDWKLPFQQNVDYIPKFLPSDKIQVEYISYDDTLKPYLVNNRTGKEEVLTPELLEENETYKCYLLTIDNSAISEDTSFSLHFSLGSGQMVIESEFCVCMDLPGTVLLEYTNRRNIKNTIFNGVGRFTFRIEGAFLPQENTFENESEDFRDQRYIPRVLSSQVYETKTLTIGGGFGVPNWVARKINLIFSASSVHVDGIPMVRSDGSAVEVNVLHSDYPLYIYKIVLEESEDFNDSQLSEYMRVIDEKKKIVRRSSPDVFRTYDEAGSLDSNAKMIRELELIKELSEYYTLEVDDNTSESTKRVSLGTVIELVKTHFNNNVINFGKGAVFGNPDEKHAKITEEGDVLSNNISSLNFTSGPFGSGHRIKDGDAEFQNLTVRGQFSVFEFIIQQVKAVGGKFCVSPASMKIGQVEELEDGYKCFFHTDDGTIRNPFVVGDQAFHQVYEGKKMNRYWRLVTEVGSDYFILSKSDCEANSGVPEADDEIVLLGNRTDRNRQSAIMISAYDENSPYIAYYAGINSYSFEGKEPMRTGNLNGIVDEDFGQLAGFGMFCENVYMKGVFRLMSGKTVEQAVNDVQSNIDNLQIGTENLISWKMMLEWNKKNKDIAVYGMDGDGVYLTWNLNLMNANGIAQAADAGVFNDFLGGTIAYKPNTQYVLSIQSKSDEYGARMRFYYTDGVWETKELSTAFGRIDFISKEGKSLQKIAIYIARYNNPKIYNISLIEGNKPLQGFPVATDDLPNNINLADGTKEVTVGVGGTNYTYKVLPMKLVKPNTAYYVSWGSVQNLIGSPSSYTAIIYKKGTTGELSLASNNSALGHTILTLNDFTEQEGELLLYAGVKGATLGNQVKYTNVMLVEGRFPATAYSPSVNEQDKKIAEFEVTLDGMKSTVTTINNSVSGLTTTVSNLEQKSNEISLSVTTSSQESKRYAFGQSWSSGKIMKGDPSFLNGVNSAYSYNNKGDGTVTVTREAKQSDSPVTSSGYNLKIVSSASATPGGGGFVQSVQSRANAIFLHRFIAKVPSGYSLEIASNSTGDGRTFYWCTSNKGTGKWEEYIYAMHCGSSGSFSTFGFVYLNPAANVTWYLAYADVFDVTNGAAPVNTGNIVNSINVSTEGIRIDASKLTISGQTLFKDSNGNSVSIFGTGDDVFSIKTTDDKGNELNLFKVNKHGVMTCKNATIMGTITATTLNATQGGKIGPFTIESSQLTAGTLGYSNYLLLSQNLIRYSNSDYTSEVYLGANALPSSTGGYTCGFRAEVTKSGTPGNIGAYIKVSGVALSDTLVDKANHALYIPNGCITGFRLRTRRISTSQTLSKLDCVIICVATSTINIEFPSGCEDGQMYWIFAHNAKPAIKLPSEDTISNSGGNNVSAKWHLYTYDAYNKKWIYSYMNI